MKSHFNTVILGIAVAIIPSLASVASGQRLGKDLNEIVQLANKERSVRVATSWEPENEAALLKGFYQKYPAIKVTTDRISGIETRERILNEALAGVVEHDLVNVSGELRNNYVKAGVMTGPVAWRKLFPNVKDVHSVPMVISRSVDLAPTSSPTIRRSYRRRKFPKNGTTVWIPTGKESSWS